jgi:hypothetical protein
VWTNADDCLLPDSDIHVKSISGFVAGVHSRIMESPIWTGPIFPVAAIGGAAAPAGGHTQVCASVLVVDIGHRKTERAIEEGKGRWSSVGVRASANRSLTLREVTQRE